MSFEFRVPSFESESPGPRGRAAVTFVAVTLLAAFVMGAVGADPGVERWEGRLEALHPDHPMAYFELAEEVADAAADDEERRLARHLFALAGVLDEVRLGRSACLALADLEQEPHLRRRLRALAALLGERAGAPEDVDLEGLAVVRPPPDSAVRGLGEVFSRYRVGDGQRALTALRDEEVLALLQAHDRLVPGGVNGLLEDCRHYRNGDRRPRLDRRERAMMLGLEAALLAGDERPFSADLLLNQGRPLIEIDPERLEDTLGVDASRPIFRDGRWVPE